MSMRAWWLGCALVSASACDRGSPANAPDVATAAPIEAAECAVCGMFVREQPAPRGQVVFRDGARAFACSTADLVQLLAAPSGHGKPARVFVEALEPEVEPAKVTRASATTWIDAESAFYVIGIPRAGIMGEPLLVYTTRSDAEGIATRFTGRVVDWASARRAVLGR